MANIMDAIRDGMAKEHTSRAMQVLGELLTEWLLKHPEQAEKDAGTKTLSGAMGAIREEARKQTKQQGGNVGVVDDQEGLRIALEFLGVASGEAAVADLRPSPAQAVDELDIDALLGM